MINRIIIVMIIAEGIFLLFMGLVFDGKVNSALMGGALILYVIETIKLKEE